MAVLTQASFHKLKADGLKIKDVKARTFQLKLVLSNELLSDVIYVVIEINKRGDFISE